LSDLHAGKDAGAPKPIDLIFNPQGRVLGLHHHDFTLSIVATFTANAVRQAGCGAVRALDGIRLAQVPVGTAKAFAGLGRFFLWNSHGHSLFLVRQT